MSVAASNNNAELPPDLQSDGATPFSCDTVFFDEHAVVSVRGELDLSTSPVLRREIRATTALPIHVLEVDLAATTFLDSSGIAVLLEAQRSATELGITFELASVTRRCRMTISAAGLADHFGIPVD